ncbi:MAG: peptidase E [Candidatus Pacebacteria bacterium]|nr:peptidase E [Candidatus Paceibacterota bacterium]MCF7862537.1 peptidase E [Candidatus Paceibacterota bacterium]
MKLILASDLSFLLNYGYALTGIPKDEMKIGYITTASKGDRGDFSRKLKYAINDAGYKFEEIDIEGKTEEEIKYFFKDKNIIHMEGGNSFYLIKVIRETGFGNILRKLLEEGRVYIGTSAGAYIMCPTIEVSDWDETGKLRFGITDFTALNYVPFVLKVHYKDEQEVKVREKIKTLKLPIRILKDTQGILVENDKCTFVGDGSEVKL